MSTLTKVIAFLVGLAAVFAGAVAAGAVVTPVLESGTTDGVHEPAHTTHSTEESTREPAREDNPETQPGGLMISERGYTLTLSRDEVPAGRATALEFSVTGPEGAPVTEYERTHEKDLHLIAVRRDLSGFQHVHPTLDAAGLWSVPLALTAGEWRVFADFQPTRHSENLTLGADLAVAGEYAPQPLPGSAPTAEVDGYTVRLDGRLVPGEESRLTLSVGRNGEPVTDLQPYLGAYGHLVALRDGDLAYLHVHPAGAPGDGETRPGPDVTFYATAPSRGDYRLFLDFRHEGTVRTAEFTVHAGAGGSGSATAAHSEETREEADHDH